MKNYLQTDSTSSNIYTNKLSQTCTLIIACTSPDEKGQSHNFLKAVENKNYRL